MYQKTVEKQEGYSKKQLARIKAVLRKIDRVRKDPEVLKSARQMIKEST
ncbi:MAG TPA: hypothetical protein VJG83_03565 [archaeon]|nr:hypothetical protein [archaeon]